MVDLRDKQKRPGEGVDKSVPGREKIAMPKTSERDQACHTQGTERGRGQSLRRWGAKGR